MMTYKMTILAGNVVSSMKINFDYDMAQPIRLRTVNSYLNLYI